MVCLFFSGKSVVLLSRNTVFDGVVCGNSYVHSFQTSPNVRRANVLRIVCFLHVFFSYHEVAKVQKLLFFRFKFARGCFIILQKITCFK